jgi:hypothetical protein
MSKALKSLATFLGDRYRKAASGLRFAKTGGGAKNPLGQPLACAGVKPLEKEFQFKPEQTG